jgi:hypothetical protein
MTQEEIQRLLATSKLPPEELQRLQGVFGQPAKASSSAYGQNVIGQSLTNVQRQNIEQLGDNLQDIKERGGQMLSGAKDTLTTPGGVFKNKAGDFRRSGGGASSAAFSGLGTLLSGDPLAAAISTPVGMAAGAVANPLVDMATQGMLKGPLPLKALAMGIRFAAPSLIGGGAQQIVAGAVGGVKAKAQEAGQYPGGPEVSVGGVPFTEAARVKQQQEREIAMEVKRRQAYGGTDLALEKERLEMQRTDDVQRIKAYLPYLQQLKDQELVRTQALNASNTGNSLALGRQAGSYGLAKNSQTIAGRIFEQALISNPYANAGMAQPTLNYSIG